MIAKKHILLHHIIARLVNEFQNVLGINFHSGVVVENPAFALIWNSVQMIAMPMGLHATQGVCIYAL